MIQGIKYVDAFPPTVEGGYSPMNMAKNTRCRVGSSITSLYALFADKSLESHVRPPS
jgi:hypothetical protein